MKKPIIMQCDLPTERCIEIWFKRMFSVCKNCGTLLSSQNSYSRDDTDSKLHTYCKPCYIRIQQERHGLPVKNNKLYLLISKKRIVTFQTDEEKQQYIKERASLAKFSRSCNEYSSIVGCNEYWTDSHPILCDQCGGVLARDDHGDLVCTVCYLIQETLPVPVERNINFNKSDNKYKLEAKENAFWSERMEFDTEYDSGTFDIYYSNAYGKSKKLLSRK